MGQKRCFLCGDESAADVLIWPAGESELLQIEEETTLIARRTERPFLLAALAVENWNEELSPWEAPPVFGKEGFGAGAEETLRFVRKKLAPAVGTEREKRFYLGGYSLAGLFALWAAYRDGTFRGVAAVSPSVWFPGWRDFIRTREILAERVYLSLGEREEKTKNRVMAAVGDGIREQYVRLEESRLCVERILEWNQGHHFTEPEERLAKGFAWLLR
ncbi:MAG: esterase [Eubacteriales bacterium]|nr:esterase [Eubacteriales bacterium]